MASIHLGTFTSHSRKRHCPACYGSPSSLVLVKRLWWTGSTRPPVPATPARARVQSLPCRGRFVLSPSGRRPSVLSWTVRGVSRARPLQTFVSVGPRGLDTHRGLSSCRRVHRHGDMAAPQRGPHQRSGGPRGQPAVGRVPVATEQSVCVTGKWGALVHAVPRSLVSRATNRTRHTPKYRGDERDSLLKGKCTPKR